ncbi:hypothetical protein OESDEN_02099 [Oesophagostomum dentatum]|uniref:Uncharacterized protein n=1 Tax=Oesophagostomum dentatum TaxID=61180 RepID=A0A0B1TK27_OESDE|nr:hypothetical protein OESDEN_02099 [Oesophagostomum dentatum]
MQFIKEEAGITIGISMLPDSLKSQAMLIIQDWSAKLATNPPSDCTKVCVDTKSTEKACKALDIVAKHISDQLLAYQADEAKKCKGKKECLEEVTSNNELIVLGVKQMVLLVSTYVDPKNSCGEFKSS